MTSSSRLQALVPSLAPHLLHLALVLGLFSEVVFGGRMLFMRDVSISYYPDYWFLSRSLAQGVWPLWHPDADAGAPFFMLYPVTVLLVGAFGPRAALALGPCLHVLLAMCGTTALARTRGVSPRGAWAAGACLGLSGYVLSSVLFPVFLALAWAPWIVLQWSRLQAGPSFRKAALLAALLALQVSTLGGEIVVQTLMLGALVSPPRLERRRLAASAAAAALALLLAAPVLLGARALLDGTPRGAGFSAREALAFSAPVPVLLEAFVPRFFGNVHTFSDLGFWGQPFFPEGFPFVLSLYLGLPAVLLAILAGADRLWVAVALGLLLSLGSHGPAATSLGLVLKLFRVPVKFFFLSAFSLALLAGQGVDRATALGRKAAPWLALPGLALVGLAAIARADPASLGRALGGFWPEIAGPNAAGVIAGTWPGAFFRTGMLCLAAGLAIAGPRRLRPLAPALAVLDLLAVNASLNPTAPPTFYELRAATREVVRQAEGEGRFRWFSGGLVATPPIRFSPAIAARNQDVWLYALERQALLPRTHVLDGIQGALDEDRTGLLPAKASLPPYWRDPARIQSYLGRLRLANVRWVVAWRELPAESFSLRAAVQHPEILDPMRIYELRDPLPRAFWVGRAELVPDEARLRARIEDPAFDPRRVVLLQAVHPPSDAAPEGAAPATVRYEPKGPHEVRIEVESGPGFVVVLDGFHPDWQAVGPTGPVPVLEADGSYRAIPTPGGRRAFTLRFRPRWLAPGLVAFLVGLVLAAGLVLAPPKSP